MEKKQSQIINYGLFFFNFLLPLPLAYHLYSELQIGFNNIFICEFLTCIY